MSSPAHRILVIGGTGAQGFAVVKALLSTSPAFKVRVLSRNPDSPAVKATFADLGSEVEFVKGSFMDFETVKTALEDCYGVYVNTDGTLLPSHDMMLATQSGIWMKRGTDKLVRAPDRIHRERA